jgi:hypothetical protein
VAEVHRRQLYVVQDEGDEAAHSSDADLVATLQNSCWPSRTVMKNKTQDANSADTKKQENSSYKVQCLHAAVPLQSGSNRHRSVVADSVVELQNSCQPSRTETKNKTRIQQMNNYRKIHLTRHRVRTLLF